MARKGAIVAALWAATWLGLTSPAGAVTVVLDSFEDGDFVGWNTIGGVSIVDSTFGVTPTDGSNQIFLTSGAGAVGVGGTENPPIGLPANTVQNIFNTIPSTGSGPTEGSAIQLTFSADAGDTLEFDWDFLTNERQPTPGTNPNPNPANWTDFAWYHLDLGGSSDEGWLSHADRPASEFQSSGSSFFDETGYQTFSFIFASTGTYTLTVGVHDVEDTLIDSGAVFDFFRLIKAPEPDSFVLLCAGLLGLALQSRRGAQAA